VQGPEQTIHIPADLHSVASVDVVDADTVVVMIDAISVVVAVSSSVPTNKSKLGEFSAT